MISDEAVEAAHKAWRGQAATEGTIFEYNLRAALESAAPYMLAPLVADLDKWAGRNKPGYYDEAQDDVVQILNPYRSQA